MSDRLIKGNVCLYTFGQQALRPQAKDSKPIPLSGSWGAAVYFQAGFAGLLDFSSVQTQTDFDQDVYLAQEGLGSQDNFNGISIALNMRNSLRKARILALLDADRLGISNDYLKSKIADVKSLIKRTEEGLESENPDFLMLCDILNENK